MIYAQPFADEPVVRGGHVVIIVLRKMRVQAIAGLGRFSVADAVGKNNEVARRIEKLAWTKKYGGELRREKLLPSAAGSVKNEHRVGRAPSFILHRPAQSRVMQAQFRQRFAGMELKIVNDEVTFRGRGADWLLGGTRHGRENYCQEHCPEKLYEEFDHLSPLRTKNLSQTEGRGLAWTLVTDACVALVL